jgi:catechol 2,3-dioxygenase-like lactoylglutathione lyase family enzyme
MPTMIPSTYVRDIDASRAFYERLGFRERTSGRAESAAWSLLGHGHHLLLLAFTKPPLDVPRLPLLFYFYFDDLDAVVATLRDAGLAVQHLGHPPHAQGGEAKVLDPDGNTVLLGQRERSATQALGEQEEASAHFSLLREAAALVAASGATTAGCQVGQANGSTCPRQGEVKLADSWGDTAWACIAHAEEILIAVPGAFIASPGDPGIGDFLARRRS